MKLNSELSVIIVNYNGGEELRRTLLSLNSVNYEVIVVDNASTEGVIKTLEEEFPQYKFIFLSKNYGFAGGVNKGISYSTKEFVYLVNPDTVVNTKAVDLLLDFIKRNKKTGAVSGFIVTKGELLPAARRYPNSIIQMSGIFKRVFGFQKYMYRDLLDVKKPQKVHAVSGTFMFLRKKAFFDVGMFDERYFLYMEDIDLCRKLWSKGWEVWFLPEVLGDHIKGDTYRDVTILKYHHVKSAFKYFLKWGNVFNKLNALFTTTFLIPLFHFNIAQILYPPWKRYLND